MEQKQKIVIFEQKGKAETKIQGIIEFGNGWFEIEVISMPMDLPSVIDDTVKYFPSHIDADLVLDYLIHPDLSHDLGIFCRQQGIPVVASGKKNRTQGVFTPPTCCGLVRHPSLGHYGNRFGAPELIITLSDGQLSDITVKRGAPCGSTWRA